MTPLIDRPPITHRSALAYCRDRPVILALLADTPGPRSEITT
jgi:hypothetical protein